MSTVSSTALAGDREPDTWPVVSWRRARVTDARAGDLDILWADPVADFLRAVHGRGFAEIRWHSTWIDEATLLLVLALNLPESPVADAADYTRSEGVRDWWKAHEARRIWEAGHWLIWTDDDFGAP